MTSSSARNTAVLTAIYTHHLTHENATFLHQSDKSLVEYSPIIAFVLFMLTAGITFYTCLLMREKRKRIEEATSLSNLPWVETLQVFTLTGRDAAAGLYLPSSSPRAPSPRSPGPPPSYDTLVPTEKSTEATGQTNILCIEHERKESPKEDKPSDDLPTYEAAVRMDPHV